MSINSDEKSFVTQVREIQENILQKIVTEMIEKCYIKSADDVSACFEPMENNPLTNTVSKFYKFYFFGDYPLRLYISDGDWESVSLSPRNPTLTDISYSLSFKPVWHERVFR